MTSPALVFFSAMQQLLNQLVGFIPKLLVAIIIWVVGKYIIGLGVNLIKRVQLKGVAKPVNKLVESLAYILLPLGKVILFLIILDYLGIGRTVINALLSGVSFAIAIAVGLAFGKAFEDDAKALVESVKKQLDK
jgi:small conductance mechanosensitive channel